VRLLAVCNRYPPWSTGGYEVVSSEVTAALRDGGHVVRVLTTRPDPSDRQDCDTAPPDVHRELSWYWRDGAFPSMGARAVVRLERANAAVLQRHLAELAPDVVIWLGMGGMSMSLIEQVRRAGVPSLGLVGDEWMGYGPRVDRWARRWTGWGRAFSGAAEQLVGVPARIDLDAAARWLFNSEYLLTTARADGRLLEDAAIAPPGIDAALFSPRPAGEWRWRLLYCGRADPRKGIATAIEALPHLPAEASLGIHGDGDREFLSELRALAARLGVSERVRFSRSEHSQVPEAYAAADAVVFPVIWREPWGLVPLEAMATGRPVAASRSGGGPAEYLEDGGNCLQFEPGDAAGLARALRRLAERAELRAALVAAGRRTAARFSQQAFHERIERELRDLIARDGLALPPRATGTPPRTRTGAPR
jgi:glycosyltransferase involved in cell wall biosynthesis